MFLKQNLVLKWCKNNEKEGRKGKVSGLGIQKEDEGPQKKK